MGFSFGGDKDDLMTELERGAGGGLGREALSGSPRSSIGGLATKASLEKLGVIGVVSLLNR